MVYTGATMFGKYRIAYCSLMLLIVACSNSPTRNSQTNHNSGQANSSMPSISIYGNWCGPEHPKDLTSLNTPPPPVDQLDRLCMQHDYCYLKRGNFNCDCDSAFSLGVDNAIKAGNIQGTTAITARSFKYHFNASPCDGNSKNKLAPTRALQSIYRGIKNRIGNFYSGPEQSESENIPPQNGSDTLTSEPSANDSPEFSTTRRSTTNQAK